MGVSQAFKDRLDDDLISYRFKFYIQDAAVGSREWVDFSDRLEQRGVNPTGERERLNLAKGVNRFMKFGSVSHKTESVVAGSSFISSIQSITMDNSDGFWDDPDQWDNLKNIRGASAVFVRSKNNMEILLDKLLCKITLELLHTDGSIEEGVIGVFRIRNSKTNSNSGTAELQIVDQSFFLRKMEASEVKNGRAWYENKPVKFLIEELLKQEPLFLDSDGDLSSDFQLPDIINIPIADQTQRVLSNYGTPPEWDGSSWNDEKGIKTRALIWGSVTIVDSGANRLFLGIDNELWSWNPSTDTYTLAATLNDNDLKIRYLFIRNSVIYGFAMKDPSGSSWSSANNAEFFSLRDVSGTLTMRNFNNTSNAQTRTFLYNSQMNYRRGRSDAATFVIQKIGQDPTLGDSGGENLILPFSQRIRSLQITDPSNIIKMTNVVGLLTTTEVNVINGSEFPVSKNTLPGYYVLIGMLYENDISSMSWSTTQGSNPSNLLFSIVEIIDVEVPTIGNVLFRIDGNNVVIDNLSALQKPVQVALRIQNTLGASQQFGIGATLTIIGNILGIKTLTVTSTVILGPGNSDINPLDQELTMYVRNVNNMANVDAHIPISPFDIEFSFGQKPSVVFNQNDVSLVYFHADDPSLISSQFLNTPVSLVSETLTHSRTNVIPSEFFESFDGNWLQPTAIATSESDEFIYVGSIEWIDAELTTKSRCHLHRITIDENTLSIASTTADGAGSGSTALKLLSATGFAKGDIIRLGAGTNTIAAISGINVTLTQSDSWSSGASVEIIAQELYVNGLETHVITNIVKRTGSSNLIISVLTRDSFGGSTMYKVGIKNSTARNNNILFDVSGISGFFNSDVRDIVEDVNDDSKFFIYTADGTLHEMSISGSVGTIVVLDGGQQAVENDPNLISNLISISDSDLTTVDGLTRTTGNTVVMGVSAPTFPNETQAFPAIGKYYLWKLDSYITDRIQLADFDGMNVWDAIGKLAQVPNYLVGFDLNEKGSFFLTKKDNDSTASVLHTFENSALKSNLISINKEKNSDEIYNYITAVPYFTKQGDLKFELRTIPRATKSEENGLLKKDDITLSIGDNIKKSLRLICIKEGTVTSTILNENPLFKWISYDREIDVRLINSFTANSSNKTFTVGSLFRGGNSGPNSFGEDANSEPILLEEGVNLGDFLLVVDPDNNNTVIRRISSLNDGSPQTLTIPTALSLTGNPVFPVGTIFKIQKGHTIDSSSSDNIQKVWSDEGVAFGVNNALNSLTKFQVSSTKGLSVDTVIALKTEVNGTDITGYARIISIKDFDDIFGGPTIEVSADFVGNKTKIPDKIIKAYYSPYQQTSPTFDFQEIGRTNMFIKIEPINTNNDNQFKEGDILTLTYDGLRLEADEQSKILASDINTVSGRLPFTLDNKFMHRRLLKEQVFKVLVDHKNPRYGITIQGGILPFLTFVDTSNELVRFKVVDKKLFKNKNQNAVLGYPREITHNLLSMTTTILIRDEDNY